MFDPARTRRGGGQTPQTDTTDRRTPRSARPFVVSPGRRRRCPTTQEVNHPFPDSWAHDKPENPNAERDGDDARQTTTGSAKTTRRIARLQESGRVCEKPRRPGNESHPAPAPPKATRNSRPSKRTPSKDERRRHGESAQGRWRSPLEDVEKKRPAKKLR